MGRIRLLVTSALLIVAPGCSRPGGPAAVPGGPQAVAALEAHAAALARGDWRGAHDRLHPTVKAAFPLKRFSDFHTRRRKANSLAHSIGVTDAQRSGDDVVVSFDALFAPPGGGPPVAVSPRRKVRLRRSGDTWGLLTHDVLAVGP